MYKIVRSPKVIDAILANVGSEPLDESNEADRWTNPPTWMLVDSDGAVVVGDDQRYHVYSDLFSAHQALARFINDKDPLIRVSHIQLGAFYWNRQGQSVQISHAKYPSGAYALIGQHSGQVLYHNGMDMVSGLLSETLMYYEKLYEKLATEVQEIL